MKLYKKISITILSLMLVFACGFLVSDIYNPSKQKVFASGGDYKYFYLSDIESSSKTSNITFYRNSSYVTLQRGSGKVEETFIKNFVIVNNGSVTYDLRGLNAERFVAYVGIDNTTGRSGTSNLVVQVDGVTKSSLDTLNSNNRYQYVDISLTNATKITFTVSNASSGAWTVLANPRVFGTNLLTGYTQTKPLELSNLPVANGYPIAPNAVDVKIRENNSNTIRLTSCSGANSTNPAKLGFNIEGTSAYYFTTSVIRHPHPTSGALSSPKIMIQRVASNVFEDLKPIGETTVVMQDTTETVVYSYIIPADTAILILATYGFDSTFVNPTLYCNNYIDLTTHPRASSDVASESITTPASLNYYINKSKTNTIAQFNKYILTHPHGDRVGYITFASDDTHATRFTAYIGMDSDVASNTTYPSDGVKFSFKAYNYFTGQLETLYPETTINYSSYRDNGLMYYVDVNLPKGTSSITLTVDKNGNNWSDHAIWCAPMLFGNNLSLYSTTIGKWQADSSGHYRKDTVNNSNAYFEAHQYSHDCDNTCNTEGCGYTRTTSHKFDNACDTTCNTTGCGYTRTITHNWGSWTKTNDTQHSRTCSVCKVVESANHSLGNWVTTDATNHYKVCSVCNSNVNVAAHSYTKTTETVATCTTKGTTRYTCSCGRTYTSQDIAIDPNNHTGSEIAGGTADAHTKWSCCKKVISSEHSYVSTQTKAPTCTDTGITTHSCDCGYTYTTTINALGHDYEKVWTVDGNYHWYDCTRCDARNSQELHSYDNDCDVTCNICDYERSITHTWATEWSADANNHWKDCIVCHNAKTQTETHSFSKKTDDNNHWQECDICKYQKEISAHGNWHYNVVDDNTHSKQCGNCIYIKNEEHSFCNWYVESYASNENKTDGVERRDCLLCSYFERRDMQSTNKASLSLKETIGLNLYIDATKYTADTNAYVELTYNHNSTSYVPYYTTDVIYLNELEPDKDNLYKFSMSFASGQIADQINLRLYDGQGLLKYEKNNYSILEYCQEIINDRNQTDELKNLCKAIINYGITSINYFDYATNLVNPNSYKQTIDGIEQEISNVPNATIEQGAQYLSISRFSFIALSDTSIRVYFDTSGFIFNDNYDVTLTKPTSVDTDMSYKTGVNDYGYFVEIYGIESANIDKLFTITISFKGDDQNKTIITYSALNFLKEKVQDENSSSLLKEMCVAIYQYNICAKNYFENN